MTVAESDNFGVLRILVRDAHATARLLRDNGFVVNETEVVAVEVSDTPGKLAQVLAAINKHHINVEYMYGFVEPVANKAMMVFRFDDVQKAISALREDHIAVFGTKDIGAL